MPPRGSAQDELLLQLHERQRTLRYTELVVLTGLLAGKVDREEALNVFRQELWEDAYRPAVIKARRAKARQQQQTGVDQKAMMDRVAKLSAAEEPAPKKGAKKTPKR